MYKYYRNCTARVMRGEFNRSLNSVGCVGDINVAHMDATIHLRTKWSDETSHDETSHDETSVAALCFGLALARTSLVPITVCDNLDSLHYVGFRTQLGKVLESTADFEPDDFERQILVFAQAGLLWPRSCDHVNLIPLSKPTLGHVAPFVSLAAGSGCCMRYEVSRWRR